MTAPPPKIRLTKPVRIVLDLLLAADPSDPHWGFRITELTGMGPGTVYPTLERLERAGWITGTWQSEQPDDWPQRRFYSMSGTGRRQYIAAQANRQGRRRSATSVQSESGGA
ncbi:helix-turn-helix transcriptional regulator [Sphaerisporangium rhizosphaerae]|uniref:Helix-turn-helix transcriptional regulator n=1 Tax=Sphaerisporangium rhizosphaerae TaxID=2269375 RepID=A0ABW2NWI2_9ACTN